MAKSKQRIFFPTLIPSLIIFTYHEFKHPEGIMSKAAAFNFKFPNLKLINSIVFFIVIWATQCLVNAEKSVSFEQHVQVQQELTVLIADYVKQNLPTMTDFKMHSVYTKPPKKGFLEAYFNYSFSTKVADSDQEATTQLEGTATLRKLKDKPNQEWALEKIEIEGESVAFTDPIVISSSKDSIEKPQLPTPPPPVIEKKAGPTQTPPPAPAPVKKVTPPPTPESAVAPTTEPAPAVTPEMTPEAH